MPVCGATSAQKTAQVQEADVASQLGSAFNSYFGQDSNILSNLTNSLTPIVAAGPGQYGYTGAEDTALRTGATENISAAGTQAANVTRQELAAEGGGNMVLPSGSVAAIEGSLAEDTAQKQAVAQNQITSSGYATGRQQYNEAVGELAGAPGEIENPVVNAGNAAENAAGQSMTGATQIQQANDAWIGALTGLAGGVAGGILAKKP